MPQTATQIRQQLTHPVIDSDAHWLEFGPYVKERLLDIGGEKAAAGFTGLQEIVPIQEMGPDERAHLGLGHPGFWMLPMKNTRDRATAMMPALLAVPVEGGHIEVLLWTERKSRLDLTTIARLLFQKLIRQLCPQALRYSIRRPSLPWAATRWRSGWWWSRAPTTSSAGSATLRAASTTSTPG